MTLFSFNNSVSLQVLLRNRRIIVSLNLNFVQFQIIRSRIEKHLAREKYVWNSAPGALAVLPKYADHLAAFPFFTLNMGTKPSAKFTAIILAKSPIVSSSASIMKLIKNVAHSTYVAQVSLFIELS